MILKNIGGAATKLKGALGEFVGRKQAVKASNYIPKKTYSGPAHILKGSSSANKDIIIGSGATSINRPGAPSPIKILDSTGTPYGKQIKNYADGSIGATYHRSTPERVGSSPRLRGEGGLLDRIPVDKRAASDWAASVPRESSESFKRLNAQSIQRESAPIKNQLQGESIVESAEKINNNLDFMREQSRVQGSHNQRVISNSFHAEGIKENRVFDTKRAADSFNTEKILGARPEAASPSQFTYDKEARRIESLHKTLKDGNYDQAVSQGFDPTKKGSFNEYAKAAKESVKNPGTWNKMSYHKAPEYTAAAVGTGALLFSMSNRRGQQSNSELYGQSSPYGM